MSTFAASQYPVGIRHNLESHSLAALIPGERAYFQLPSHKQLGALLDIGHAFCQFAKAADRKEDRLAAAVAHRQAKVAVLFAALSALLDFTIPGGVADQSGVNSLVVQKSSPP